MQIRVCAELAGFHVVRNVCGLLSAIHLSQTYRCESCRQWRERHRAASPTGAGNRGSVKGGAMAMTETRARFAPAIALGGLAATLALPAFAASGTGQGPSEVIFIAQIVALMVAGRLLGEALLHIGQPAVMGQLIAGLLLGASGCGSGRSNREGDGAPPAQSGGHGRRPPAGRQVVSGRHRGRAAGQVGEVAAVRGKLKPPPTALLPHRASGSRAKASCE